MTERTKVTRRGVTFKIGDIVKVPDVEDRTYKIVGLYNVRTTYKVLADLQELTTKGTRWEYVVNLEHHGKVKE
jgi:hypothetical protein